ncbi:MAG: flagellar basal body-associated FliL family protein [Planctomycetales bacterium]|nr:flagellar basal body-associated FliL family protein [Planctomycetales bacterium]
MAIGVLWLMVLSSGCSGSGDEAPLVDPLNLIENFDPNPARHHPTKLAEVPIGSFALSRPSPDRVEVVSVSFSAFIIVPIGSKDKFDERIKERQARIADLVNGLVQRATFDDLNSSELLWLKGELQPALSRALQTDEIRDVIITEFSISVG